MSVPSLRGVVCSALAVAWLAAGAAGCAHRRPETPAAPSPAQARAPEAPPAAPAHGYRHAYGEGVELAFDSRLGVYSVVGYPDHYFHDGRFYVELNGTWIAASRLSGPWTTAEVTDVPASLQEHVAQVRRDDGRLPASPR